MQEDPGSEIEFPVDDATYNLLQTLTSKLESLDAYRTYIEDAEGEEVTLYQELARDDMRHAERILEALRESLGTS
jgi:rubrerythrin